MAGWNWPSTAYERPSISQPSALPGSLRMRAANWSTRPWICPIVIAWGEEPAASGSAATGADGGRAPGGVFQPCRLPSHQVPAMPTAATKATRPPRRRREGREGEVRGSVVSLIGGLGFVGLFGQAAAP